MLENVKDGVRAADMVERFNQIGMEMGEEDADFDALSTEMSDLRTRSTRSMAGHSTTSSKWPWMPCAARRATGR